MHRLQPALALGLAVLLSQPDTAGAHFLELVPKQDVLPDGGEVMLKMILTHPSAHGPVLDLARPDAVTRIADGRTTDLLPELASAPVQGKRAWVLTDRPGATGAMVYAVTSAPYWEPAQSRFIRQYAKVEVDSRGSSAGWDKPAGLPVEIAPLSRPTGLWAGNAFTGVVLKNGQPVPYARIEVEFLNTLQIELPNRAFETQVLRADANGTFSYVMPFAAWWGFAARLPGDVPMFTPEGGAAPLEEDAVIWVQATQPRSLAE